MTEPLYTGIQGVDVNWMATLPGMEDIEELAASLPEKCPKCGGTGWVERMCDFCTAGHSVTCDCQRERGEQ